MIQKTHRTSSQGIKEEKMKLKIFFSFSLTSNIFLLGFLIFLCIPKSIDGLCTLQKNDTHANCNYLDDIEFIDTHELNSLRVSTVGKYLYPGTFANLTNLKHLDLSNGILSKIQPKTFDNLYNLRSLNLSNNHLINLKPGTLNDLKHLHSLYLSKNYLNNIPLDISKLNHLKYLDLSSNNINCDCKTLKQRDLLLGNGVKISRNTICSGLHNLGGKSFIEPEADAVCMFDEQDLNVGMQGDAPIDDKLEGSGEESDDSFDHIETDDIPDDDNDDEDDEKSISQTSDAHTTTSMMPIEIPLTSEKSKSSDDELFFTEDNEKHLVTSSVSKSIEDSTQLTIPIDGKSENNNKELGVEGSGDDDAEDPWTTEGSGFEGSGIGIVPPITWNGGDFDTTHDENKNISTDEKINSQPTSSATTEGEGIVDTLYNFFWGPNSPPVETTTTDLNLEEEQFILASSTTQKPEYREKNPVDEKIISPTVVKSEVEKNPDSAKNSIVNDSKSGKVQAEIPINNTESSDASTEIQSKKGMGSYIVLAILLGVLGALIGFAAYKGDFCSSARKRNNDHPNSPDIETGTELKDLTKSLLDNSNSVQPKISSSNGGKHETIPLVTSSGLPTEIKNADEPMAKYVGTLANESSADPVKPPRKSYSPNEYENGKKNGINEKFIPTSELSVGDDDSSLICPIPMARDALVNGKNNRDSLSSIGHDSPSLRSNSAHLSNPRLSQGLLPPASPHAQRVKITLQDNPDSVPKTPLLITRTKAGENLVKTP